MRRRSMVGVAFLSSPRRHPDARSTAGCSCRALDGEAEERSQPGADDAADERRDEPQPAMQTRRCNAAEISADIAAIGEPGAIAEEQPADHRSDQRAGCDAPFRLELAGERGGEQRTE